MTIGLPESLGASVTDLDPSLDLAIRESLRGRTLAVALYGSRARGTARAGSDVDVLQIVQGRAGSYSCGQVNISAYRPQTLIRMARRGSLFVLHLKTDAIVISDPFGVLGEAFRAYRTPSTYEPLFVELRAAAMALHSVTDTDRHWAALRHLGLYLLRTAVYAKTALAGTPEFDVDTAATMLGFPGAREALTLRYAEPNRADDLQILLDAFEDVLGPVPESHLDSVEALAVALANDRPYASGLLAQVLIGGSGGMEYTALAPPPL
jgi:Nucleotidyltransferase domain